MAKTCWIAFVLFLATYSPCPSAALPSGGSLQNKRFMPSIDEESKAKIDEVVTELRKKFGEVPSGFFDKLKESITSIPGTVKDKVDSIIHSIFDLFGGNKKHEHELSAEEKAFREKFNKVLEELKTTFPKRFMPSIDEETKKNIDNVISELRGKFGEVDPGFFDKLKETITSIPGTIKDKIDSIISGVFDLFGGNKHKLTEEEKEFRKKFDKVLEELKTKVPVTEAKRFLPPGFEGTKEQIDEVIKQLKEKFGEVGPGFFDKLKETMTSLPGKVKDKVDSIISGIFDLFGGNKVVHELTPEEKAFRKKFNKVLAEMKTKVSVIEK